MKFISAAKILTIVLAAVSVLFLILAFTIPRLEDLGIIAFFLMPPILVLGAIWISSSIFKNPDDFKLQNKNYINARKYIAYLFIAVLGISFLFAGEFGGTWYFLFFLPYFAISLIAVAAHGSLKRNHAFTQAALTSLSVGLLVLSVLGCGPQKYLGDMCYELKSDRVWLYLIVGQTLLSIFTLCISRKVGSDQQRQADMQ